MLEVPQDSYYTESMKIKEIELLLGAIYSLSCHYPDQDDFCDKVNELYSSVFGA